jgi:hypothetical protein
LKGKHFTLKTTDFDRGQGAAMDPLSASVVDHRCDLLSSALFAQFLDERRYLKNVTPDTIEWYETAFKT